ncbi:hypothetical protein CAPTEDRAFT_200115 [Capitella teleta]|uniref:Uncharacterized protein n=1 Tax=Capitella teleta TaxID=283909 RepID=R7V2H3_CAPTE|nr:hypothetical protein CAPTEDRAFT_200115 [Capitella teleta]|eukprot:ELU13058.1 hypothetical protein CAPTEDRAFT_200115 [Capitella teleta]
MVLVYLLRMLRSGRPAIPSNALPRLVVRDPVGVPLNTDTGFQRRIHEARQRMAGPDGHRSMEEGDWRLPHSLLPSRPDYSRTLPQMAADNTARRKAMRNARSQDQGLQGIMSAIDEYSMEYQQLKWSIQQAGTLPALTGSALIHEHGSRVSAGRSYLPFVGIPPVVHRKLSETEAVRAFRQFCVMAANEIRARRLVYPDLEKYRLTMRITRYPTQTPTFSSQGHSESSDVTQSDETERKRRLKEVLALMDGRHLSMLLGKFKGKSTTEIYDENAQRNSTEQENERNRHMKHPVHIDTGADIDTTETTPKPFKIKQRERKSIEARSPFSTERTYDYDLGKGFNVKRSDKKLTEFDEIERGEHGWKEPDAFKLKSRSEVEDALRDKIVAEEGSKTVVTVELEHISHHDKDADDEEEDEDVDPREEAEDHESRHRSCIYFEVSCLNQELRRLTRELAASDCQVYTNATYVLLYNPRACLNIIDL